MKKYRTAAFMLIASIVLGYSLVWMKWNFSTKADWWLMPTLFIGWILFFGLIMLSAWLIADEFLKD